MKRTFAIFLAAIFALQFFAGASSMSGIVGYLNLLPQAQAQRAIFSDVTTDNTNVTAIEKLQADGLINGYSDGTYKPDQEMNRAEFIKILIGSLTLTPKGKNCFSDVHDEWFAPYVCEAKTRGIVTGDGVGNKFFRPGDKMNFSESAKIVTNVFNLQKGQADASIWYKQFVVAVADKKAAPLSVEYFDENVTRGETAEMVWRLRENVTDKASRTYDEIAGQGLYTADSCTALQGRYAYYQSSNYGRGGGYGGGISPMDSVQNAVGAPAPLAENKMVSAPAAAPATDAGSNDYSSTNVQVQGVDEADVIKNDGQYIYLVKGSTVRIVQAYPADSMKELAKLDLSVATKSFTPTEIYVDGNSLVVIGTSTDSAPQPADTGVSNIKMVPSYYPYYSSKTTVFVVNITDRTKPKVLRSVDFDASYNTSRKIGGTLYMVMNKYPSFPVFYDMPRVESEIKSTDILPMMRDSAVNKDEPIAACNRIKIFPKPSSFNFLITAAVPLTDLNQPVRREVVVGSSDNVYASQNNLYVASTDWSGPYMRPINFQEQTKIYKFGLADGNIVYLNQGSVPGTILNQFSMDEYSENFRIATTTSSYSLDGGSLTDNNLYVLDSSLKNLGKIEHIATGEKIYSVRFLGARAYMVTFKSIDPLFVIGLADPTAPKILGKLKIPGYSTYLHPYDENHIIGFGKDVDESIDASKVHSSDAVYYTAVLGIKIGLFDVTDVNNPKEMFKEVVGGYGTDSELLTNHKALLFDKDKQLFAFPVTVYEGTAQANKLTFVGAYVYKLNLTDGFKLLGKVTHLTDTELSDLALKSGDYFNPYYDYAKTIQRILYIGENLYTVSQAMIKANALVDLKELKSLVLQEDVVPQPVPVPLVY